jgi:MFS family permease
MAIYGRILREPGVAVLIAAATLTRLPFAINGLAVILFMREATGSFATAGLVAGSLALGAALGAPFAARLVDRRGAVWLMPLAIVHGAAILALWGLGEVDAPSIALVATGLVAGASFPPSGAVLRSRWPELLAGDPELVRGA